MNNMPVANCHETVRVLIETAHCPPPPLRGVFWSILPTLECRLDRAYRGSCVTLAPTLEPISGEVGVQYES